MISFPRSLKRCVHRGFQMCGYDFARYTPDNFMPLRRARILAAERVRLVLDVGASEGTYPLQIRQHGYRERIISFEPLKESFAVLSRFAAKDRLWSCQNVAVGNYDGTVEMNVSGHKTSSSVLPISTTHLTAMPSSAMLRKERIRIVQLDSLLGGVFDKKEIVYLKIDVQGYERHVLEGAKEVLKQTRAVELELSLVPMYEGGAIMVEMLEFLSSLGFVLASLNPVFSDPVTGFLLQVDGICVKQG